MSVKWLDQLLIGVPNSHIVVYHYGMSGFPAVQSPAINVKDNMRKLNEAALADWADIGNPSAKDLFWPNYNREMTSIGVVHLGLGAFHRAHQAMVFDALIKSGDTRWGVLGVGMRTTELADALATQDGLYSVQLTSESGVQRYIIGSVLETCVASREPEKVIAAIADENTRWITLTVTEKAYGPALCELLTQGLAARRKVGRGGLTIASCDNLSDNGKKLRKLCLDHVSGKDSSLAEWIGNECSFPSTMVDRVVPAATEQNRIAFLDATGLDDACALGAEAYWEWVIERDFVDPKDEAVLVAMGANVVDNVKPFEDAKLRMLNGSHTAIAAIGMVMGLKTVDECIRHPSIHRFVFHLMTDVFMPHLKRPGLEDYRDKLLRRFANPELKHRVQQISSDSSLKISFRWRETILAQLARGDSIEALALASAVWIRFLSGSDERGGNYVVSDPMSDRLLREVAKYQGDAHGLVLSLMSIEEIWGKELSENLFWKERVKHWLQQVNQRGVDACLMECS